MGRRPTPRRRTFEKVLRTSQNFYKKQNDKLKVLRMGTARGCRAVPDYKRIYKRIALSVGCAATSPKGRGYISIPLLNSSCGGLGELLSRSTPKKKRI